MSSQVLGEAGQHKGTVETEWEQQCVYKGMAVPNWKMLLGEGKTVRQKEEAHS